jgi:DNA helicase-2/ATP-dependent DNA helicase PcrA
MSSAGTRAAWPSRMRPGSKRCRAREGKTFATMARVRLLLEQGATPERILVVTLTRTAAEDLKRSLQDLGVEGAERVVARTLHSHCFSILGRAKVLEATGVVPRIVAEFEKTIMLRDLEGDFGEVPDKRKTLLRFAAAWSDGQEGHAPGEPVEQLDQQFQNEVLRCGSAGTGRCSSTSSSRPRSSTCA